MKTLYPGQVENLRQDEHTSWQDVENLGPQVHVLLVRNVNAATVQEPVASSLGVQSACAPLH